MLAVRRALIRRGRLIVDARVAPGVTGTVTGVTAYNGLRHSFTAPISGAGKIRIREALPLGHGARIAWVGLSYRRTAQFYGQWVVLQAAPRDARLRLTRHARATAFGASQTVRGTVAPDARGSVVVGLTYRTARGAGRLVIRRTRIRSGEFARSFRIPAGAHDAILYAVFPGDADRGIGGGSRILVLR
jgi:hypothetical protein